MRFKIISLLIVYAVFFALWAGVAFGEMLAFEWDEVFQPIQEYILYESEVLGEDGLLKKTITAPASETTIDVDTTGFIDGEIRYYTLSAMDSFGRESLRSNEVQHTFYITPVPDAPQNFREVSVVVHIEEFNFIVSR